MPRRSRRRRRGALLLLALLAAWPPPARGQAAEETTQLVIPDVAVVDQEGRPVRFYSDLVHGKVVMMNFVFTTCTTICPPLGATFAKVRKLLGERAGRDVQLISVSIDPAADTRPRNRPPRSTSARSRWSTRTGRPCASTATCSRGAPWSSTRCSRAAPAPAR